MMQFIDSIYMQEDITNKTKLRLLRVIFVDIMEDKQSEHKNLLNYIRELIKDLER